MKRMQYTLVAVSLLLASPVVAYDQPLGLNLGYTSFLDGGPPAGPGWYFAEYLAFYTADKFPDAPSGPAGPPASNAKVDAWVSLNQLLYQSDTPVLFGGKWGLDIIVPLACLDAEDDHGVLADNGGGVGDLLIGPYLQWDPIMGDNGPKFMHRVELQVVLPTGKYDHDKTLNPSNNHCSFNPYWAGTYFFTPKLTSSWRVHYLWNGENDDPFIGSGALRDTQAGAAWHANFAAAYEVLAKQLRVGVNGYYFKQTSSSEVDGAKVGGKEEVFAIGPGALWSFSQHTHLFVNLYFETDAEVRPEGERFLVRLVHHFQ